MSVSSHRHLIDTPSTQIVDPSLPMQRPSTQPTSVTSHITLK